MKWGTRPSLSHPSDWCRNLNNKSYFYELFYVHISTILTCTPVRRVRVRMNYPLQMIDLIILLTNGQLHNRRPFGQHGCQEVASECFLSVYRQRGLPCGFSVVLVSPRTDWHFDDSIVISGRCGRRSGEGATAMSPGSGNVQAHHQTVSASSPATPYSASRLSWSGPFSIPLPTGPYRTRSGRQRSCAPRLRGHPPA